MSPNSVSAIPSDAIFIPLFHLQMAGQPLPHPCLLVRYRMEVPYSLVRSLLSICKFFLKNLNGSLSVVSVY